jgi:hypothetical protein
MIGEKKIKLSVEELRDVEGYLLRTAMATGTAIYGPLSPSSDVDYVLSISQLERMQEQFPFLKKHKDSLLKEAEPRQEYPFVGVIKILRDIRPIDIIVVCGDTDLMAWKYATRCMFDIPMCLLEYKAYRKRIFGWFLNLWYDQNGEPDKARWPDVRKEERKKSFFKDTVAGPQPAQNDKASE